jgi:hypothetical protein
MLVRVLRRMSGHVDGVDLTRFEAGRVYALHPEHAAFVVAIGAGQPADSDAVPINSMMQGVLPRETRRGGRYSGRERRRSPR